MANFSLEAIPCFTFQTGLKFYSDFNTQAFSACFPRLKIFQLALSNWAGMFNSGWISGQTETFSMESPIWFQKNFFWSRPPKRLIIPLHGVGRVFFFGIGCPVTAWLPSNLKMWATMQPWLRVHSVWNRLIWNSSRNIKPKWWRRQMVKPHHLMRRNTADFYGTCVQ